MTALNMYTGMPHSELEEHVAAELVSLMRFCPEPDSFAIPPADAYILIGVLQLAVRDLDLPAKAESVAESLIAQLASRFGTQSAMGEQIRRGGRAFYHA